MIRSIWLVNCSHFIAWLSTHFWFTSLSITFRQHFMQHFFKVKFSNPIFSTIIINYSIELLNFPYLIIDFRDLILFWEFLFLFPGVSGQVILWTPRDLNNIRSDFEFECLIAVPSLCKFLFNTSNLLINFWVLLIL